MPANPVGGMAVDDAAYARLVRLHSAKRQTRGGRRRPRLLCREARGAVDREGVSQQPRQMLRMLR